MSPDQLAESLASVMPMRAFPDLAPIPGKDGRPLRQVTPAAWELVAGRAPADTDRAEWAVRQLRILATLSVDLAVEGEPDGAIWAATAARTPAGEQVDVWFVRDGDALAAILPEEW
jgi:hypothetical protein